MAAQEFVLANIPESYRDSELITDYLEGIVGIDVEEVKLCPYLPDRALVFGKYENYHKMAKTISETPLESHMLEVFETHQEPAVVVEDLDVTKLSEEFACLYFESVFAEGHADISSSHSWPEHNLAVFKFKTPTVVSVVKKILEQTTHLALPSEKYEISVGPFYHNFHDQLKQVLEDKCKEDEDTDGEEENEIKKPNLLANEHRRNKHIVVGEKRHKNHDKAEEVTSDSDRDADSNDDEDNKRNWKEEKESEEESDGSQSDEVDDEDTDREQENKIKKPDLSASEHTRRKHIVVGEKRHKNHNKAEEVTSDSDRDADSNDDEDNKINRKEEKESEEESDGSQSDEVEDEDTDREQENKIKKPDLSGNEQKRRKHIMAGDGIHKNLKEEVSSDSDSDADCDDDEDNKINRKEEKESEEESDGLQSVEAGDEDTDGELENEIKKPNLLANEQKRSTHIMVGDGTYKNLNKAGEVSSDSNSIADSDDEGDNRDDLEDEKEMEMKSGCSYSGKEQGEGDENEEEDEKEAEVGAKRKGTFISAGLATDTKIRNISTRGKYRQGHDKVIARQSGTPDSSTFQAKSAKPTDLSIKQSIRGRRGATYKTGRDKKSHRSTTADDEETEFSKTPMQEHMYHDHQMIRSQGDHTLIFSEFSSTGSPAQLQCQNSLEKSETLELHSPHKQAILDMNERRRIELEDKLKKVNEENARLREKQKVITENIDMEVWQFELLSELFGQFGDCRVYFSRAKKNACLEGPEDEVREKHKDLLRAMKDCKYEDFQLSPVMQSLLSSERGRDFLDSLQKSELKGVKLFHHEKSLIILPRRSGELDEVVDKLRKILNYKETRISKTPLPRDKMMLLKIQLEKKLLVGISWEKNITRILVEGVRDDVMKAINDVDNFLDENGDSENEFSVSGIEAKFINTYMSSEISHLIKSSDITEGTLTDQNITIKLKGKRSVTNQICRDLERLKTKITTKKWNVKSEWRKDEDLWLLTQGFHSDKIKEKIQTFEHKNQCFVITTLPKLESFKIKSVGQRKPVKSSITSQKGSQQRSRPSASNSVSENLKFTLAPTCEIVIKSAGDIVEDTSDLLVSVLDSNMDLRKTRVGRAFIKLCPSLWKHLKAEQDAHPTDPVLTTKGQFGGLRCQAICHVILSPWDPSTSPAQLDNAVRLVLRQAVSLGVKSVSFPPLGCGRALQFPAPQVAQIVIASIKSETLGKALNRITFLAPDLNLFKELKSVASNISMALIPHPRGAVGGSEQDIDGTESSSSEDDEESDDDGQIDVALQETSSWNICIMATHGSGLEKMWSELKQEIDKICLHTDYFNQDIVEFCPGETHQKIIGKAKELFVWVRRSPNPRTKKLGYSMKGNPDAVEQMKAFIRQELNEISKHLPKKRIQSSDTPKRGTHEFLRHATESDEPFPSYWRLNKSEAIWKEKFFKRNETGVKVDPKIKSAIKKLITQTFDPSMTKAKGSRQKSIKVIKIRRVENHELFEAYQSYRKQLFRTWLKQGKICPDIGKLPGSKGRVITTERLEDFMKRELYYEVNEHYLFHETSKEDIGALSKKGIDPRVSSGKAKFVEKFTSDLQDKQSDKGVMVLARILLGNVFIDNPQGKTGASPASESWSRPPCVQCYKEKCGCSQQTLYDSVIDVTKPHREFIIYSKEQYYPEYIIEYKII